MDNNTIIGYAVTVIITLGSFIAVIMKFTQPINDLRVVIQKLNDNIDVMKRDNEKQGEKLDAHDEKINELDGRVGKLEVKVNLYHDDRKVGDSHGA